MMNKIIFIATSSKLKRKESTKMSKKSILLKCSRFLDFIRNFFSVILKPNILHYAVRDINTIITSG